MGRGGGGGSRGGGGRSGGSHGGSSRSSSSGGRGRSYSSGSRGPMNYGGHYHMHGHYYGPGGYRRYEHYGGPAAAGRTIMTFLVIFFMIIFTFISLVTFAILRIGGFDTVTRSTIKREKLDSRYVTLSDEWYDDSAMGWISSGRVLEDGLKDFYNDTGVQPYLVITDQVYGDYSPTGDEVWDYANQVYDRMFSDEGHMVFVFQCPDGSTDYTMAACTGAMAKTVLDDGEALEILYDYIDHYFYTDLDEDEMFAMAFSKAGERIMHTQMSPVTVLIIAIAVIIVVTIVWSIVRSSQRRDREKAEETERILNAPLEKFGDQDLDDLKEKYNQQ